MTIRGITFDDRNLIERRFTSGGDSTRYRKRLRAIRPVAIFKQPLRLFAYDEAFYDHRAQGWTRNWFALCGSRTFGERLTVEAHYLRQNARYSNSRRSI